MRQHGLAASVEKRGLTMMGYGASDAWRDWIYNE
jgi:hypothetical protein